MSVFSNQNYEINERVVCFGHKILFRMFKTGPICVPEWPCRNIFIGKKLLMLIWNFWFLNNYVDQVSLGCYKRLHCWKFYAGRKPDRFWNLMKNNYRRLAWQRMCETKWAVHQCPVFQSALFHIYNSVFITILLQISKFHIFCSTLFSSILRVAKLAPTLHP